MSHHHDEGLAQDLAAIERARFGRRRLLSFGAAGTVAALVAACSRSQSPSDAMTGGPGGPGGNPPGPPPQVDNGPVVSATSASGEQCIGYTTETNGPYPADGTNTSKGATSNILKTSGIERSDIRSDIGGANVAPGLALDLTLTLVDVNDACKPMAGYAIYIWHCDADGNYSLYDLPERSWLRGLQVTDDNGQVHFRTIFPGAYMGRYPHIHFEVFSSKDKATGGKYASLISQLAMPKEDCEAVYELDSYADSVRPWEQGKDIDSDNVFGDNGEERIAAMTLDLSGSVDAGFSGKAVLGMAV